MKFSLRILVCSIFLTACSAMQAQSSFSINFDTDGNWTAGSGTISSYQSDHVYAESGWSFTGGPALRNGNSAQDSVAGALGTYSWRLRDETTVSWTATYTQALSANEYFDGFSFSARRWDGSPSPAYTVEYSLNGGTNWAVASNVGTSGVLDNAGFGNSSNWAAFSQTIGSTAQGLAANQFVVRFSATGGERIMVDNFGATTALVPEPNTFALLAGFVGLAHVMIRRRKHA